MAKKKKKKDPKQESPQVKEGDGFGLVAPTGNIVNEKSDRSEVRNTSIDERPKPKVDPDANYKQMAWKGFEEEEEDPDPDIAFGDKEMTEDELDMTPMVDVTFLLLIFFMVTASFTLQQSLEQPPSTINDPSPITVEREDEDDYVEVIIDQTNTYYVTSRDEEEVEAPSDREMRSKMRDFKEAANVNRLIITAHVDSQHGKVITAWDAGTSAGMDRIEIRTTEDDY